MSLSNKIIHFSEKSQGWFVYGQALSEEYIINIIIPNLVSSAQGIPAKIRILRAFQKECFPVSAVRGIKQLLLQIKQEDKQHEEEQRQHNERVRSIQDSIQCLPKKPLKKPYQLQPQASIVFTEE